MTQYNRIQKLNDFCKIKTMHPEEAKAGLIHQEQLGESVTYRLLTLMACYFVLIKNVQLILAIYRHGNHQYGRMTSYRSATPRVSKTLEEEMRLAEGRFHKGCLWRRGVMIHNLRFNEFIQYLIWDSFCQLCDLIKSNLNSRNRTTLQTYSKTCKGYQAIIYISRLAK